MLRVFLGLMLLSIFGFSTSARDTSEVKLNYGDKGFRIYTADGDYSLNIQGRLQFRYATPFDRNPIFYAQLSEPAHQVLKINRARLKVGGNAYKSYLKYYFEYDMGRSDLLDFRVMFEKWAFLNFKIGQWKVNYNRERVISSGKQQMVDRSLLNTYFTLDRQQGVTIYGNVGNNHLANLSYEFSLLTGAGRAAYSNPTNNLMYIGHLQWNFCGSEMIWQESDIQIREKPIGAIALSVATFEGPYVLFSTSGGADYFFDSDTLIPNYKVNQLNFETSFMKNGFSWQNENHLKWIENTETDRTTQFAGTYFQAGYFFNQIFEPFPKDLELAVRYAIFTPNMHQNTILQREYSFAANYFFHGHSNKLTAEYSYFDFDNELLGADGRGRFRVQWDILF